MQDIFSFGIVHVKIISEARQKFSTTHTNILGAPRLNLTWILTVRTKPQYI